MVQQSNGAFDPLIGYTSEPEEENSGGLVNYYLVVVNQPQRKGQEPYQAECEDIIDALELTFDEANIFKEIWRTANARNGKIKSGHTSLRAAEKIHHYAGRILRKAQTPVSKK